MILMKKTILSVLIMCATITGAHATGSNTEKEMAISEYQQSAENGDPGSQYLLGLKLSKGNGVKKDYLKAMEWFKKSAEQGNADAAFSLGAMYHKGMGVEVNKDAAIEWYEKAAERGNYKAQFNLGTLYGNAGNYMMAEKWLRKGAMQGEPRSQYRMGTLYESGIVVGKDLVVAHAWYSSALVNAQTNDPEILNQLHEKRITTAQQLDEQELARSQQMAIGFIDQYKLPDRKVE